MTDKRSRHGRHLSPDEVAELEKLFPLMTPTEASRQFGCNERTALRHFRRWKSSLAGAARVDKDPDADLRSFAMKEEIAALKRDLKSARKQSLNDDILRALIGKLSEAPVDPPDWLIEPPTGGTRTPEVPMTIWSDWHGGEVVSSSETNGVNIYDPEVMEARVRVLVASTIDLCRNHGPGVYPGIVVNLLGDNVSGGLHPELAKSDAEGVIPSSLRCRDLLVWALTQIVEEFGAVYVPCVCGNHGRNTPKPEFKGYVHKSFDWLIYQMLARHFDGDKRIIFDIPDSNEVLYRVYGKRFLAMHGDMLGVAGGDGIIGALGPIARGEVKVGKQSAAVGRDYDVLLMGHWHQSLWLPKVIVANTLKGWDEYAKNKLRAPPSEPTQPLWFVHPRRGITSRWDVRVEEPSQSTEHPWVSWPAKAA